MFLTNQNAEIVACILLEVELSPNVYSMFYKKTKWKSSENAKSWKTSFKAGKEHGCGQILHHVLLCMKR